MGEYYSCFRDEAFQPALPATRLFIGGLAWEAVDSDLEDAFSKVGPVATARVVRYTDTGRSKGFGFVEMSTLESAMHAQNVLDGVEIAGRSIKIDYARPRREREGGEEGKSTESVDEASQRSEEGSAEPDSEFIAFGLFGDKVRVVSLSSDGRYEFMDEGCSLSGMLFIASGETAALKEAIDELESLVNDTNTKEADLQDFFERHRDFLLNDEYKDARPHVKLMRDDGDCLIPDFVLQPVEQSALCDLLELKLPSSQIYVLKHNRMRFSAAVFEAAAQLREYSIFFDEERNRIAIQENYGLIAYKPKMFVIIGRRGKVNAMDARKAELGLPDVCLRTYDDLLSRMKSRMENMTQGR